MAAVGCGWLPKHQVLDEVPVNVTCGLPHCCTYPATTLRGADQARQGRVMYVSFAGCGAVSDKNGRCADITEYLTVATVDRSLRVDVLCFVGVLYIRD